MHPLVYLVLLAGPCVAHYRFSPRYLVERDELQNRGEWVDCPVCETPTYSALSSREECEMYEGKSAKLCLHGTYINEVCGSRRDCYRGPGEQCTEKKDDDEFGQKCAPGYMCSVMTGQCMGLGNPYKHTQLEYVNQYPLGVRRGV